MTSLPHANTLTAERKAHLANIFELERRAPKLDPEAAARALRTIENIQQQVTSIDSLLGKCSERAA